MSCPVYQLSTLVNARLRVMNVSAEVSYDDERFPDHTPDAPRVEFYVDTDVGDTFVSAMTAGGTMVDGVQKTPRALETTGALVRISGASTKEGAGAHDHKGEVRELVRNVMCAIVLCSHKAKMPVTDAAGHFVAPPEPGVIEIGARYELRFGIRGAVEEVTGIAAGTPLEPVITTKAIRKTTEEISSGPGP